MSEISMVLAMAGQGGGGGGGNPMNLIMMIGLMIAAMWFILWRPQQKKERERQRMLSAIGKGDRVVTVGGIHGKVMDVDEGHEVVSVEVSPKIVLKFTRQAVSSVESKKKKDPDKDGSGGKSS